MLCLNYNQTICTPYFALKKGILITFAFTIFIKPLPAKAGRFLARLKVGHFGFQIIGTTAVTL